MEMWLKGAIVALLTVIGATLVLTREDRLNLVETNYTGRRERTVSSGSSLKLHCCLTHDKAERCHISWHFESSGKNLTEMEKNKTLCNQTIFANCSLVDICYNMTCNLSNINESDTGWYYCKVKVEIPRLSELQSYKTKVIVTSEKEDHDQSENLWMWIIVGASSFVLVVIALLVIRVVQKRGCSRSIEEPIYANTRTGKPSPRLMPADNPKSASSSQDLRTPISARGYEGGNQRYKY
ncbi:uncharacterized protein LOC114150434 isoform X2 [Xiphophorus couchianus]|uniref:uncharacterized protein LOC114150434 isoform X2 n=1 Tax=Xiphophorus couchianus TaxID=32473 RepID=UPI001016A450|nr:uncharacterized protein LOC114150434 isoform X2 [Xiphophorus couchianus]